MTINRSQHPLPSTWDSTPGPEDKHCLQINGSKVKYIGKTAEQRALILPGLAQAVPLHATCTLQLAGPGDEDKDAASVRADRPIPSDVSLYYYEVQVINKGRDGFVGMAAHL